MKVTFYINGEIFDSADRCIPILQFVKWYALNMCTLFSGSYSSKYKICTEMTGNILIRGKRTSLYQNIGQEINYNKSKQLQEITKTIYMIFVWERNSQA